MPTKLTYPTQIASGEKFEIAGEWVNRAVGRAMRDFNLRLVLVNADGNVVATADAGPLETSKWAKGKTYPIRNTATFKDVAAAGTYNLCLALVDPKGGAAIGLPLKDADGQGGYRVGNVTVSVSK